jgi:hypothetical protein
MKQTQKKRTDRREFLNHSLAAFLGIGCLPLHPGRKALAHHHAPIFDEANVHNMLIVGQKTVFLSHLPMFRTAVFDSPHRYQVILEASFTKAGTNPQALYASDRKSNPKTKIYTLNPDEFILPNLIQANANPPLRSFKANIVRGHLEKPGKKLLVRGTEVRVENIIHFREFDPKAATLTQLEYILFGKGNELFLAHLITRPPDFDQVLAVSIPDHRFTDEELGKGLRLVFGRSNTITQRLLEKQEAVGELRPLGGSATPIKVKVKAATEFYFEEGELRTPANFNTTSAEKLAGFP